MWPPGCSGDQGDVSARDPKRPLAEKFEYVEVAALNPSCGHSIVLLVRPARWNFETEFTIFFQKIIYVLRSTFFITSQFFDTEYESGRKMEAPRVNFLTVSMPTLTPTFCPLFQTA